MIVVNPNAISRTLEAYVIFDAMLISLAYVDIHDQLLADTCENAASIPSVYNKLSSFLLFFFYWLHAIFPTLCFHVSCVTVLVLFPTSFYLFPLAHGFSH
jgi:hypothetical protein